MYFSIIIVNFNTKNLLINCIKSLLKNLNRGLFEIIVVDNNSKDNSLVILDKYFKNSVKVIKNKKNLGFGAANNLGAKIAEGKYLFFLNSDTLIKKNILNEINELFIKDGKVGIVSPKLLMNNGEEQSYAFGKFPSIFNIIKNKFKPEKKNYQKIIETDWVSGAAMIVKKDIFKKLGGFDQNFFMYFEDIDLCKNAKHEGYKVVYTQNISIIHLGGKSIIKNKERKEIYYKSQDYFFKKHYGFHKFFILKIFRLPYKLFQIKI